MLRPMKKKQRRPAPDLGMLDLGPSTNASYFQSGTPAPFGDDAKDLPSDFADFPEEYTKEQLLGEGVSSAVYRGVHNVTGELVAVKVLHTRGGEAVRTMTQEFQLLKKLQHPNIVRVIKLGRTRAGQPWVVQSYVSGSSLEHCVIEAQRPLDE